VTGESVTLLMKLIALLASFLFCVSVQGSNFDYTTAREWVEKECATNAIPKAERVFIVSNRSAQRPEFAGIIRFRQGIKLREIVDQTPFKNATITIMVMNERQDRSVTVNPSANPEFEVRPLDVLWILEERRAEDGPANGSQPFSSETNRTSPAAGSRR
jgi:hypothetical protein